LILPILPPPRPPLFPYTTLFRSCHGRRVQRRVLNRPEVPVGDGSSRSVMFLAPASRAVAQSVSGPVTLISNPARAPLVRSTCASDRKSTRLNSSHDQISYAVFCL